MSANGFHVGIFARALWVVPAFLVIVASCERHPSAPDAAVARAPDNAAATDVTGNTAAALLLATANATLVQSGAVGWQLSKTGQVDASTHTVAWTITATQTATIAGQLVISGVTTVANTGSVGATIGNIVVNLQTKSTTSGVSWISASADVADATSGDAATTAHIDRQASSENKATFSENAASGHVQLEDAATNTVLSLVPEITIAPAATRTLRFSASFDNTVLSLPVGTAVRAEVLVSFGNAGPQPPSASNVDINGNGVLDADEAWVRTVPARLGLTVPAAATPDAASVAISDGAANITTTGTVTFSNATFSLGATSGTVGVSYDGGASGGTITNCATLTGSGVNAQACNTETIRASTCTAGAPGCEWLSGDMLTFAQADWGGASTVAVSLLTSDFNTVYASSFGVAAVGLPSPGFSMSFTDANAVIAYLPAVGPLGPLDADLSDPTTTASGQFGGDVVALQLNVDFADVGFLHGTSSVKLGDLTLCGLSTLSLLNGTTVRQVLASVNSLLGGGGATYSITDMDPIAIAISSAFLGRAPSTFAQQHLVNGTCP